MQALLEGGADPLVQDAKGKVALHPAAESSDTDVVGMLLNSSAPSALNIADSHGFSALGYAAGVDRRAVVSYLLSAGATETIAVLHGLVPAIRLLLDGGLDAAGRSPAIVQALQIAITEVKHCPRSSSTCFWRRSPGQVATSTTGARMGRRSTRPSPRRCILLSSHGARPSCGRGGRDILVFCGNPSL